MRLEGKRTVITGASSGIGRSLALRVAENEGVPVLLARRPNELARVADEIRRRFPRGPEPLVAVCDIRDRVGVSRVLHSVYDRLGGIDILVNNAGISLYGLTSRTRPEDFGELLDVNLLGPLHATLEVLPWMLARGDGLIVNVASAAALYGVPYLGAYGASKAALATFGQSLRAELRGTGVRVMNVYPGYTRTEIFAREKRLGGARRPTGNYAPPERVASSIVRAMASGRVEVTLSLEGRGLACMSRFAPRLLDLILGRLASRLRVPLGATASPASTPRISGSLQARGSDPTRRKEP